MEVNTTLSGGEFRCIAVLCIVAGRSWSGRVASFFVSLFHVNRVFVLLYSCVCICLGLDCGPLGFVLSLSDRLADFDR